MILAEAVGKFADVSPGRVLSRGTCQYASGQYRHPVDAMAPLQRQSSRRYFRPTAPDWGGVQPLARRTTTNRRRSMEPKRLMQPPTSAGRLAPQPKPAQEEDSTGPSEFPFSASRDGKPG